MSRMVRVVLASDEESHSILEPALSQAVGRRNSQHGVASISSLKG